MTQGVRNAQFEMPWVRLNIVGLFTRGGGSRARRRLGFSPRNGAVCDRPND